jgi:hypothetical protein
MNLAESCALKIVAVDRGAAAMSVIVGGEILLQYATHSNKCIGVLVCLCSAFRGASSIPIEHKELLLPHTLKEKLYESFVFALLKAYA